MKRILTAVVLIPVVLLMVVWAPLWLFAAAVALVAVLSMREYLDIAKDYRQAIFDIGFTTLGYTYVAIPFVLFVYLRNAPNGIFLIIFLFATVWVGDAAAYYIGKNFGRHLLAPALSPKKTWEGSIASVI